MSSSSICTSLYSCHFSYLLIFYLANALLILFSSALVTTVDCLKSLFLFALFLVRMWLLYALYLLTLPVPVILNRLLAPLWDFILAILISSCSNDVSIYLFWVLKS